MDDLLTDFIAETRETLEAIAEEIVAWEQAPEDRARLDAIFRFVHTVKGSCGFLDLPRLEKLSHAAEDALAEVRAGARAPDAGMVTAVLAIVDRIGALVDAIESGESLADDDQRLIAALAPGGLVLLPQAQPQQRVMARSIRVPVDLLDRMMGAVSDLVLARNELSRKLRDAGIDADVEAGFERLSDSIADMRDTVTRTRMARIEHLFSALPRMVRDLSAELGKSVALGIDGGDVELDREMIEMIRDPLTHIIRNAVDHGIEPPADRILAGKPRAGQLRVSARQAGNQILIEIADDGRGIDGERLVQKAIAAGVLTPERATAMSWARKLALIFEPGLSTAAQVTAISGRGVGMDVVRANIERIGGVVELSSRPGEGLRLSLRVPLTLTIIPALTVSAGGHHFAIPRSAIEEIVRVGGNACRVEIVGGATLAVIRGTRMPVVPLDRLLDLPAGQAPTILVVLKRGGSAGYALAVDAVHDHEELVVKPAAPAVMAIGLYAGATLPDDNRPMLLLDPAGMAAAAGIEAGPVPLAEEVAVDAAVERVPALLFEDLQRRERLIRLSLVERIEDFATAQISMIGGRACIPLDGQLLPLAAGGSLAGRDRIRVLRLGDGTAQIVLPIERVVDIVDVGETAQMTGSDGTVTDIALLEGRPVELVDAHQLFAEMGGVASLPARTLCLLDDDGDSWMREVLAPLVRAAGYRVVHPDTPDAAAASITISQRRDDAAIRLRSSSADAGDGSIYRYDRPALIEALRRASGS